jgi:hypothetical protein
MSKKKENPENERELVWIDSKKILKEKSNAVQHTIQLNQFINSCEKILGTLTNEQKILLKDKRMPYLREEVKKLFQFPNASDEFNMQSLGIDLSVLDKWRQGDWDYIEFFLEDGKFIAEIDQPFEQQHHYYADTENKKEILRIAYTLSKVFDDAAKIGLIQGGFAGYVCNAFGHIVKVEGDPRMASARLEADLEGIAKNFR